MSSQPAFLIDFAFPSKQMLYSVYCQLSHSLAVVWGVTHVAIALYVDRVTVHVQPHLQGKHLLMRLMTAALLIRSFAESIVFGWL